MWPMTTVKSDAPRWQADVEAIWSEFYPIARLTVSDRFGRQTIPGAADRRRPISALVRSINAEGSALPVSWRVDWLDASWRAFANYRCSGISSQFVVAALRRLFNEYQTIKKSEF